MADVAALDPITALGILAEPTRRALYEYVIGRDEAVGRDEAAGAVGIGRPLAAFHLDRLVAGGLLTTEFRRTNGRRGPGAGRPAKLYRRGRVDLQVSLPPRRYEWAARILAAGLEGAGPSIEKALAEAARASGRSMAGLDGSGAPSGERGEGVDVATRDGGAPEGVAAVASSGSNAPPEGTWRDRARLREILREQGFEPRDDPAQPGVIRLLNCPFDAVARTHRAVVCAMNLALLQGFAEGFPNVTAQPADPATGCCVALRKTPG